LKEEKPCANLGRAEVMGLKRTNVIIPSTIMTSLFDRW
jgi:hypothetical protein